MKKHLQTYIIIMLFSLLVVPSAFAMETKNTTQDNEKLGITVAATVFAAALFPKEKLTNLPKEMNDILLLKQDMEKAEKWFDTFNKSAEPTQTANNKKSFLNNLLENGPIQLGSPFNFPQNNQDFSLQKFNGSTIKKSPKPQKTCDNDKRPVKPYNPRINARPVNGYEKSKAELWEEKISEIKKSQNCNVM